jgi:endonuclease/exonuclease/phosphatase family metal-dependent hydrolase
VARSSFVVCNWNIAGAKFLEKKADQRDEHRKQLHAALKALIENAGREGSPPDVLTLQEVVRFGASPETAEDLLDRDEFKDYHIYVFPLVDSDRQSSRAKWEKVAEVGGWPPGTYFAQGNAMMIHKNAPHCAVFDLPAEVHPAQFDGRHFIEQVNLESGLYFGDRDTEPRAALVAHFVLRTPHCARPLDVFVINLHLTTLTMEREGIPEIDTLASKVRLTQLDVIFTRIVSRYNLWRQRGYLQRGKKRPLKTGETDERFPPMWVLSGDFNFTPESVEYQTIMHMNFMDVVTDKGFGTKAKGIGEHATLTLDYIFAGPKFISLDPLITQVEIKHNAVMDNHRMSDHFPMFARLPADRDTF